jgi:hypothetical protein
MQRLDAKGHSIDIITLKAQLTYNAPPEAAGRVATELASLLDGGWILTNVGHYVEIIRRKTAFRQAIEHSNYMIELARSEPEDIDDLVARTEKQIEVLRDHCAGTNACGFPLRTWDLSPAAMLETQEVLWTIEPLMAAPDVVCLIGDGGVGKSKVAAAIALSVAFEKRVLGQFPVRRSGRVVYLNEERPDLTRRHLHTLAPHMGIDPSGIQDRITLFGRGQRPWWVTNIGAQRALIRCLKQMGDVELIIFDSLHVLHDAEENDNAEMTRVIESFRRICLDLGCCGLIIHHTGKGVAGEATPSARGASAIKDSVDGEFMVRRAKKDNPAELRIHQDKTRRALVPPFLIRMEHDSRGDVLAIDLVGEAPSKAETALADAIAVINAADVPLKSAEVALKLAAKYRKEDVYAALKVIRERNLVRWQKGPHGVFIYGTEPDDHAR